MLGLRCAKCRVVGRVAKTYVALAADGLVAVVLGGEGLEGRLDDTTTKAEDQVEGRLLWRSSVFLFSEDSRLAICRIFIDF